MGEYECIRQNRASENGAAALASVARFHGLSVNPRELSTFAGLDSIAMDLGYLLFAARKLGFDALPLEGDFEHLPEAARPCIVKLGEGGQPEFAVLFEIDEGGVLLGDTKTGTVQRQAREDFCSNWNGDVLQVVPDVDAIEAARKQLAQLRDPAAALRRILGLKPRSLARLAFVPAVIAIGAILALWHSPLQIAIGLCLIFSLWSGVYSGACASCSKVKQTAGALPLAKLGAAGYAVLFALAVLLPVNNTIVQIGIYAAAGIHIFLLGLMAHSRLICWSCVATALSGIAGAVTILESSETGWPALATPVGLLFAAAVILTGRKLFRYQSRVRAQEVAAKVLAEKPAIEPGHARIVVFVHEGCPACALYKAVIRPSLEADFGEVLAIEEREAGKERIGTPLYVITGAVDVLAGELPPETAYESLQHAVGAALAPENSRIKAAGGLCLIGFGL
ncbi:MAG TPA: cysteine peptidase family C39 domain-containing protein [Bryobacteraceae bacterium]|nr:cysteine peptidase family C39 domain-containing protein [Bryobacteraceae bacterium]